MKEETAEPKAETTRERADKKTLAEAFLEAARRGLPTRCDQPEGSKDGPGKRVRFVRRSP